MGKDIAGHDPAALSSGAEQKGAEGRARLPLSELPPLTVAIQAGGESRRMGQSKATVPFLGRPLLQRIVDLVAPIADEILITTNEQQNLGFLQEHAAAGRIRFAPDVYEQRGSLTGLVTALSYASHDYVAVCACDMIFISCALFQDELAVLAADPALDLVLPHTGFGFEPFHGVYRRQRCRTGMIQAVEDGLSSIRSFVARMHALEFSLGDVVRVDPEGLCFVNANTPDELAKAEKLVRARQERLP